MATALTALEVAQKWAENSIRAKPTMEAGIRNTTEAPTLKAAAAVNRYADGCSRAATDGSFVKGCQAVTLEDWKQASLDKIANLDKGVRSGQSKMSRFMESFLPMTAALSKKIQAMPKGDIEESIARIRANIEGMKNFAKTRSRR